MTIFYSFNSLCQSLNQNFCTLNFWDQKSFWTKNIFGLKVLNINFWTPFFWGQTFFGPNIYFHQKDFFDQKLNVKTHIVNTVVNRSSPVKSAPQKMKMALREASELKNVTKSGKSPKFEIWTF